MRRIPHLDTISRVFVDHGAELGYRSDDSSFNTALARSLEQVLTTELETPLEDLPMSSGAVVDIATDIDEWAKTYSYRIIDGSGIAEFMNAMANNSMPLVSLSDDEVVKRVAGIHLGYQLSREDIGFESMSARNGRPMRLRERLNKHSVRGFMELNEGVAMFGDTGRDLQGFANHPNVPILGQSGTDWLTDDGDVIKADLTNMLQAIRDNTVCTEMPNAIMLPERITTNWKRDYVTSASTVPTGASMMEQIRRSFPEFTFGSMCRLQSDRSFGNLARSRVVMYKRDQEAVRLVFPMRPQFFEPQWVEHVMTVPGMARIGGIDWRKVLTAEYMDVSA